MIPLHRPSQESNFQNMIILLHFVYKGRVRHLFQTRSLCMKTLKSFSALMVLPMQKPTGTVRYRLSQCCALSGMKVGTPIDIRNGVDISTSKGRAMTNRIIREQQPDVIILEPVCGPWSNMQNINDWESVVRCCLWLIFVLKLLSINTGEEDILSWRIYSRPNCGILSPCWNFRRNKVLHTVALICVVLVQEILFPRS